MNTMKMRYLKRIETKSVRDKIRNETCRQELKIESIIQEEHLSWFGHVCRTTGEIITNRVYERKVQSKEQNIKIKEESVDSEERHQVIIKTYEG